MVNFKFSNNGRKCIRQILQTYQSGNGSIFENKLSVKLSVGENLKNNLRIPSEGESVGYTVKSMEKDFPISNYPLEQTEFLYDSKQGRMMKESERRKKSESFQYTVTE